MKKRLLKKSEVLREGYIKGLKKAHKIISEMYDENGITEEWEIYDTINKIMSGYKEMRDWEIGEIKPDIGVAKIHYIDPQYH